MSKVGCFEVKRSKDPRWKDKWEIFNTITQITHFSFGSREEIVAKLLHDTPLWELKRDIALGIVKPRVGRNGKRPNTHNFTRVPRNAVPLDPIAMIAGDAPEVLDLPEEATDD